MLPIGVVEAEKRERVPEVLRPVISSCTIRAICATINNPTLLTKLRVSRVSRS